MSENQNYTNDSSQHDDPNNIPTQPGEDAPSYMMEGYTTLNFNMNVFAMEDDDSDDEDEHEDQRDSSMFSTAYYELGAENKRINGVKTHTDDFSSNFHETIDNDESDAGSENDGLVPADFQAMAEQALRGLDEEHRATLERSDRDITTLTQTGISSKSDGNELPTNAISPDESLLEAKQVEDVPLFKADFPSAEILVEFKGLAAPKKFPAARMKFKSKEVNLSSIQEAMKSIRNTDPKFASTLDARSSESAIAVAYKTAADASYNAIIKSTQVSIKQRQDNMDEQQMLSKHPIIPTGPLAAFKRNTLKARNAAHNLSRSATLSEAMYRLWPLICFRKKLSAVEETEWLTGQRQHARSTQHLTLHIIGSDGVECSSEESVRNSVGSFVRWFDAALKGGVLSDSLLGNPTIDTEGITLSIEFSGPNMPDGIIGKAINLLPQTQSRSVLKGLVSATCIFRRCEYHECTSVADLTVAFNAGIW